MSAHEILLYWEQVYSLLAVYLSLQVRLHNALSGEFSSSLFENVYAGYASGESWQLFWLFIMVLTSFLDSL